MLYKCFVFAGMSLDDYHVQMHGIQNFVIFYSLVRSKSLLIGARQHSGMAYRYIW